MIDVYKASGIIIVDRKLLFVRAKGKDIFYDPGGKVEPGERAEAALARELWEELSIRVNESDLTFFGEFDGEDPGKRVHIRLFVVAEWEGGITPSAEIAEVCWVSTENTAGIGERSLGTIFGGRVLPLLKQKGLVD